VSFVLCIPVNNTDPTGHYCQAQGDDPQPVCGIGDNVNPGISDSPFVIDGPVAYPQSPAMVEEPLLDVVGAPLEESATEPLGTLPDNALVCRGGGCTANNFKNGSGVVVNPDGTLSGISVQSAENKLLKDLAAYIPNNQVGVTTVGEVRALGGEVVPEPLPNLPYHAGISWITPEQAENLFQPTIQNPIPKDERIMFR
jgi:hypothetical protein